MDCIVSNIYSSFLDLRVDLVQEVECPVRGYVGNITGCVSQCSQWYRLEEALEQACSTELG